MFVTRFHWFLVLTCNVQAPIQRLHEKAGSSRSVIFLLGRQGGVDKTEGNKGSSEIGTCLFQHRSNAAASRVTRVTLSTRIHVHERIGTKMLQRIEVCSRDFSISRINWPDFPWRQGHSQMECDSIHSTIERAKQSTTIFLPSQWHPVVQMARKSSSYYMMYFLWHMTSFWTSRSLKNQNLETHKLISICRQGNRVTGSNWSGSDTSKSLTHCYWQLQDVWRIPTDHL